MTGIGILCVLLATVMAGAAALIPELRSLWWLLALGFVFFIGVRV